MKGIGFELLILWFLHFSINSFQIVTEKIFFVKVDGTWLN
jgi:hypothetical protein